MKNEAKMSLQRLCSAPKGRASLKPSGELHRASNNSNNSFALTGRASTQLLRCACMASLWASRSISCVSSLD